MKSIDRFPDGKNAYIPWHALTKYLTQEGCEVMCSTEGETKT